MDEKLVKGTFCGREEELRRGIEVLKSQLDLNGKLSKTSDKRPWIIHGESRSGKSHLARRIFADLPKSKSRIKLMIPAREKVEAILVMGHLFRELLGYFRNLTQDQTLPEQVWLQEDVRLVDRLIDKMELFLNQAQSATITTETSGKDRLEVGGNFTGLLAQFLGKYAVEKTQSETRQIILKPPTAETLAQVCGVMVELLLRKKLIKHVLVLVDDVDLLEGGNTSEQVVRVQRSLLADALCVLHSQPGIDVVLTARSWYAYSSKEFEILVDLLRAEMTSESLVDIYESHLKTYAKKSGIESFLTPKTISIIAQEVSGLPGVFLHYLKIAFYEYQQDEHWDERDIDWFIAIFRDLFDRCRNKCTPAAICLEQAAKKGQMEMQVEDANPFFGTVFENLFVFQSYYNEKMYFAAPIVRRFIKINNSKAEEV